MGKRHSARKPGRESRSGFVGIGVVLKIVLGAGGAENRLEIRRESRQLDVPPGIAENPRPRHQRTDMSIINV